MDGTTPRVLENAEGDRPRLLSLPIPRMVKLWLVSRQTSGSDEPAKHPVCD